MVENKSCFLCASCCWWVLLMSAPYKLPSWLPANLYIDWQLSDVTEGVCPAAWWGRGSVFMWWGMINGDWNAERKQTRPHRHLSFTKPAQLTAFFFNPSSLTTTTLLDYVTHWHTCRLLCLLHTHFFFLSVIFFFLLLNVERGAWVHAPLHLHTSTPRLYRSVWLLTCSWRMANLLTSTNPAIVSSSVRARVCAYSSGLTLG